MPLFFRPPSYEKYVCAIPATIEKEQSKSLAQEFENFIQALEFRGLTEKFFLSYCQNLFRIARDNLKIESLEIAQAQPHFEIAHEAFRAAIKDPLEAEMAFLHAFFVQRKRDHGPNNEYTTKLIETTTASLTHSRTSEQDRKAIKMILHLVAQQNLECGITSGFRKVEDNDLLFIEDTGGSEVSLFAASGYKKDGAWSWRSALQRGIIEEFERMQRKGILARHISLVKILDEFSLELPKTFRLSPTVTKRRIRDYVSAGVTSTIFFWCKLVFVLIILNAIKWCLW